MQTVPGYDASQAGEAFLQREGFAGLGDLFGLFSAGVKFWKWGTSRGSSTFHGEGSKNIRRGPVGN